MSLNQLWDAYVAKTERRLIAWAAGDSSKQAQVRDEIAAMRCGMMIEGGLLDRQYQNAWSLDHTEYIEDMSLGGRTYSDEPPYQSSMGRKL